MEGIVYLITNSVNGKKYVGSTRKTLDERMKSHKKDMKAVGHKPLYQDMKEYGIDKFSIEPILCMKYFDIKEMWLVEDAYISIYDTINNGYNNKYNTFRRLDDANCSKEYVRNRNAMIRHALYTH